AESGEYYITREFIFIQTRLDSPPTGLLRFSQSEVVLRLVDSNNQPLPDYGDSRYRLDIEATVSSEQQSAPLPVTLVHDPTAGTLGGLFTPLYAGTNHLSVKASVIDEDSQRWDVLVPPYADFDL